ncbi:SDR family NAD(P)-dependent oxidoreductase [Nakamurella leprariae]|uniref:Glucose 1-dehydrogenase n=1 Tax=Nakamurella leprariae TaxID=2803911 RepID=A0A938YDS5_9ACTN|nr:glucose 1-dehydrogenase [Nakamurella leprariae]MBM9467959.1 glucose 1-dehydrogenase [Nakamurella leprariae]
MKRRHEGKVAFVTGAGAGIGRSIVEHLAAEGARIVVTDVDETAATTVAEAIAANGGEAIAAPLDVRSAEQIDAAVARAEATFGGIHLLANNAGVVTSHSLATLTEEAWDLVVDVNLKGQFLVARAVGKAMARSGGGAIVNLSTIEALVVVTSGATSQPHYNASKGGVPMLTKALAVELAGDGIRVNCVAPGPIATNFFDLETVTSEAGLAFMRQRLLIPRVGQPEDVAKAVSFLLSDEASFIDGVQLPVDGGWLTR